MTWVRTAGAIAAVMSSLACGACGSSGSGGGSQQEEPTPAPANTPPSAGAPPTAPPPAGTPPAAPPATQGPASGGETRWVQQISGAGEEGVWGLRTDGAGNLVAVVVRGAKERQAVAVRSLSPGRALRWERIVAGEDGAVTPLQLAVSPGGAVFLSSYFGCTGPACSPPPDMQGMCSGIVRWSAGGVLEWQRTLHELLGGPWNGQGPIPPWARALAVDPSGRLAFTFEPEGDGPDGRPYPNLLALDAAGAERWSAVSTDRALAFAPDGSLYAASGTRLRKLDAAGRLLWETGTGAPVVALATSARGTVVALSARELAVHEAADGAPRFRRALPMVARDVAVQPGAGDVIRVAVVGQEASGCRDLAVQAYDLSGALRWTRSIAAAGGCAGAPQANGVAVLASGEVVVGGTMTAATDLGAGAQQVEGPSDGFLAGFAP